MNEMSVNVLLPVDRLIIVLKVTHIHYSFVMKKNAIEKPYR